VENTRTEVSDVLASIERGSVVAIVVFALLTASPALGAVAGIDRDVLTGTGGGHPGRDLTLP